MVCYDTNRHPKSIEGTLVANAHLVDNPHNPAIWSLLNRFRTGQGHCGACRKTWRLCCCNESVRSKRLISHIVESCLFTKLNRGSVSTSLCRRCFCWPIMVLNIPQLRCASELLPCRSILSWKFITGTKQTKHKVIFPTCKFFTVSNGHF